MTDQFVHLHVRTEYSKNGFLTADEIFKKTLNENLPAVGLADQNILSASPDFRTASEKYHIKPVIGCELTLNCGDIVKVSTSKSIYIYPLVFAVSGTGYHNLCYLSSIANQPARPDTSITFEDLENHQDGLLMLTGSFLSAIGSLAILEEKDIIIHLLQTLLSIFGHERLYIELQRYDIKDEVKIIKTLYSLSRQLHLPTVAVNPVFYISRSDEKYLDKMNNLRSDTSDIENITNCYYRGEDEIKRLFSEFPEAVNAACEISRISQWDSPGEFLPPVPDNIPRGERIDEFFRGESVKKFKRKIKNPSTDKRDRFSKELDFLLKKRFVFHFFIIDDLLTASRNEIFIRPESFYSSYMAFLWGFHKSDPLKHGVCFEHFMVSRTFIQKRIDIFIPSGYENVVSASILKKYDNHRIVNPAHHIRLRARPALKETARLLQIPDNNLDEILSMLPEGAQLNNPTETFLKNIQKRSAWATLYREARVLENRVVARTVNQRVILFQRGSFAGKIPLVKDASSPLPCSQFDLNCDEIQNCMRVHLKPDKMVSFYNALTLHTPKSTPQADSLPKKLRHDELEPLKNIISFDPLFVNNEDKTVSPEEIFDYFSQDPSVRHSYYPSNEPPPARLVKYIEDISFYLNISPDDYRVLLSGYSKTIEPFISEKNDEKREHLKNDILQTLKEKRYKTFALFRVMLLGKILHNKKHYPQSFWAGYMNNLPGNPTPYDYHLLRKNNINYILPDINRSGVFASVSDEDILPGLSMINQIGEQTAKVIIDERNNAGVFREFKDLYNRLSARGIHNRIIEILIRSGALDSFKKHRAELIAELNLISREEDVRDENYQQGLLEGIVDDNSIGTVKPMDIKSILSDERKYLNTYRSVNPLHILSGYIQNYNPVPVKDFEKQTGSFFTAGVVLQVHSSYMELLDNDYHLFTVARVKELFDTPPKNEDVFVINGTYGKNIITPQKVLQISLPPDPVVLSINIVISEKKASEFEQELEHLKNIATRFRGYVPLYFNIKHPGGLCTVLRSEVNVDPDEAFVENIKKLDILEDLILSYV